MCKSSVLGTLNKGRLTDLGRDLGITFPPSATKDAQIASVTNLAGLDLPEILRRLRRDELRAACRAHGLDGSGRAREDLMGRLLSLAGLPPRAAEGSPLWHVATGGHGIPGVGWKLGQEPDFQKRLQQRIEALFGHGA